LPKRPKSAVQQARSEGLDLDLNLDLDLSAGGPREFPDPLAGVEYAGDLAADAAKETTALEAGFKAKALAERERMAAATDSEYWFAVCFVTREQKEEFLRAMKWLATGDKYLDGTKLARQMKIPLPPADVKFVGEKRDKKIAALPSIG
jgi:hypothetical protein